MKIGEKFVNFQIDCGATCNIIPINLLNPDTQLEHTEKVLVMYNKTKLAPLGTCKVKVRNLRNNKLYRLEFQVVDQRGRIPLLGKKASEAMKLIKAQYENILTINNIVKKEPRSVKKGSKYLYGAPLYHHCIYPTLYKINGCDWARPIHRPADLIGRL